MMGAELAMKREGMVGTHSRAGAVSLRVTRGWAGPQSSGGEM